MEKWSEHTCNKPETAAKAKKQVHKLEKTSAITKNPSSQEINPTEKRATKAPQKEETFEKATSVIKAFIDSSSST